MALPSEVWALLIGDLGTLGVFATRGQSLTEALPAAGPNIRLAFAWPEMREIPAVSPGSRSVAALLQTTWSVKFAGNTPDQSAGPQGSQPNTASFIQYDTGIRLRQLFYGPCALRTICNTITVDEVYIGPPGPANAGGTFEGWFVLTVRYLTDDFISTYTPAGGTQARA